MHIFFVSASLSALLIFICSILVTCELKSPPDYFSSILTHCPEHILLHNSWNQIFSCYERFVLALRFHESMNNFRLDIKKATPLPFKETGVAFLIFDK